MYQYIINETKTTEESVAIASVPNKKIFDYLLQFETKKIQYD